MSNRVAGGMSTETLGLLLQSTAFEEQREELKNARGEIKGSRQRSEQLRDANKSIEKDIEGTQEELKEHNEEGPGFLEQHFKIGNHNAKSREYQAEIDQGTAESKGNDAQLKAERNDVSDALEAIKETQKQIDNTVSSFESMLEASKEVTNRIVRA
jgi:chromosome segregation ATPase